jgi:hypothetical protein
MTARIDLFRKGAAAIAVLSFVLLLHDLLTTAPVENFSLRASPIKSTAMVAAVPGAAFDASIYNAIAARPLFAPSRRPVPAAASPALATAGPPPINFTVAGVVDGAGQQLAIILPQDGSPAVIAHQGSVLGGWTITRIANSAITLQAGGFFQTLKVSP